MSRTLLLSLNGLDKDIDGYDILSLSFRFKLDFYAKFIIPRL